MTRSPANSGSGRQNPMTERDYILGAAADTVAQECRREYGRGTRIASFGRRPCEAVGQDTIVGSDEEHDYLERDIQQYIPNSRISTRKSWGCLCRNYDDWSRLTRGWFALARP